MHPCKGSQEEGAKGVPQSRGLDRRWGARSRSERVWWTWGSLSESHYNPAVGWLEGDGKGVCLGGSRHYI